MESQPMKSCIQCGKQIVPSLLRSKALADLCSPALKPPSSHQSCQSSGDFDELHSTSPSDQSSQFRMTWMLMKSSGIALDIDRTYST